ncbi:MAG: flavodoxin family protein [Bacteroidales bacterium]|nr:flavodoxin family protein [Bacteroidales bacterium]
MKKVVVISTSMRAGSNSHALAEQFAAGAKAAGNEVDIISLRGKEIKFCIGCFSCQRTGKCVFDDDVPAIMESVLNADVVCWATPIYYYEMSGQMKTLIDRLNPMFPKDYKFREIYLLTTASEDEAFVPQRAESGLQGWIDCFGKCSLKAHLFCGGVTETHEIEGNPKLQEAYELGENV